MFDRPSAHERAKGFLSAKTIPEIHALTDFEISILVEQSETSYDAWEALRLYLSEPWDEIRPAIIPFINRLASEERPEKPRTGEIDPLTVLHLVEVLKAEYGQPKSEALETIIEAWGVIIEERGEGKALAFDTLSDKHKDARKERNAIREAAKRG